MGQTDWNQFTFLVTEDEEDLRVILCFIIEKSGAKVFSASSGEEGLSILKNEKVDLVISDVRMPGMDGVEYLTRIREMHPKHPLILLITGQSDINEEEAKSRGAFAMIHKPFNKSMFVDTVNAALEHIKNGI